MILGALAAALSVGFAVVATRGSSTIERRLRGLGAPRRRIRARTRRATVLTWRLAGLLVGALVGCTVAWALGLGVLPVPLTTYFGYMAPGLIEGRRVAERRGHAERAMITMVEWLHALVGAGRPIESAVISLTTLRTGSAMLDESLARVRRDYTLGVPLHQALAREGSASDIGRLTQLADRLERARDLGRGVLPIIQELRDELRSDERAAALDAASQIEGKLMLLLTLCYLPALALVVIIPLFLTLLARLFT